jgi:hypothetical protein
MTTEFNDHALRLKGKLPIQIMSFADGGEGDQVCDDHGIGELTDSGHGFVEIGMHYGDERVYVRFRLSDLIRAIKEHNL